VKWGINLNQAIDQPPTLIERFAQSSPGSPGMIAGWDLQGGWRVWFADGKPCGPCIGAGGKAEEQLPATQTALSEISLSGCGGIGLSPDGLLISWGTSCPTNLRSEILGRRFQSIATASSYAVGVRFPCPADLDSNDSVDAGDISIALLEFGACDSCDADLDQSGEVDAGDISLMLLDFGRCP
jgi:hypothetical protein